jgi:dihydropyrimidine dehydrogenase (NAD+) subunit PreA
VSLINTISSITAVNLDTFSPEPSIDGKGSHGGYCGPAVKPIALHFVSEISTDDQINLPISGIGGIRNWQDAVEFVLLGATTMQVCTAVMHRGFGVIKAMVKGLETWLAQKNFDSLDDARGLATPRIKPWGELDLNYRVVAEINEATCIHCGICYASCDDGCYQAVNWDKLNREQYLARFGVEPRKLKADAAAPNLQLDEGGKTIDVFTISQACVGCNMCALACPVEGCITMKEVPTGKPPMNWREYQKMVAEGAMEKIPPKQPTKV